MYKETTVKLPKSIEGKKRWYEDMNKRNEVQAERNLNGRRSERGQMLKYFRPKYTRMGIITGGKRIRIDTMPYNPDKNVSWLTPLESFKADVKKVFRIIQKKLCSLNFHKWSNSYIDREQHLVKNCIYCCKKEDLWMRK